MTRSRVLLIAVCACSIVTLAASVAPCERTFSITDGEADFLVPAIHRTHLGYFRVKSSDGHSDIEESNDPALVGKRWKVRLDYDFPQQIRLDGQPVNDQASDDAWEDLGALNRESHARILGKG
ncbi:hypothetical protein ACFL2Q_13215 [Thermodesulfobacteriota bacterium]